MKLVESNLDHSLVFDDMTKCFTLLCVEKSDHPLVNSWNFLDKYEFVFLELYPDRKSVV